MPRHVADCQFWLYTGGIAALAIQAHQSAGLSTGCEKKLLLYYCCLSPSHKCCRLLWMLLMQHSLPVVAAAAAADLTVLLGLVLW